MFKVKYAFIECLLSLSLFMVPFHVVAADDQAVQALTLALEECDLAQEDRVSRQPIQAQVHIQRFSEQRDNALSIDASVADDEEVAERIRRCDRLSAIVKRSNQAFEQQQAAIDNVVEESNLYRRECELGLQILQSGSVVSALCAPLPRPLAGQRNTKRAFRMSGGHLPYSGKTLNTSPGSLWRRTWLRATPVWNPPICF